MSYTIPMFINVEAWEEWCEYRRVEKKNKVGPMGAKKQHDMLREYTHEEQQEIIDTSIAAGWTGLFPLKAKPKQPANTMDLLQDRDWAKHLVEDKNLLN